MNHLNVGSILRGVFSTAILIGSCALPMQSSAQLCPPYPKKDTPTVQQRVAHEADESSVQSIPPCDGYSPVTDSLQYSNLPPDTLVTIPPLYPFGGYARTTDGYCVPLGWSRFSDSVIYPRVDTITVLTESIWDEPSDSIHTQAEPESMEILHEIILEEDIVLRGGNLISGKEYRRPSTEMSEEKSTESESSPPQIVEDGICRHTIVNRRACRPFIDRPIVLPLESKVIAADQDIAPKDTPAEEIDVPQETTPQPVIR